MNEAPQAKQASQPLQVYVVEDSPLVQQMLTEAVQAAGAEVDGCTGEAKRAIGDVFVLQPDVIFIDIRLASGSGLDVLKALHEHNLAPGAVKVVLTNFVDDEYQKVCRRLGADRFFDKSFETSEAVELITMLAEEKRRSGASKGSEAVLFSTA
jgi:DNA-binding NarL/FixJ family response regulator